MYELKNESVTGIASAKEEHKRFFAIAGEALQPQYSRKRGSLCSQNMNVCLTK